MKKIYELKELIKKLSQEQKILRPQRKRSYQGKMSCSNPTAKMRCNKYELRHLHIAYGLLCGTPYELIEKKVADNNAPSWSKIEAIKKEYTDAEVICTDKVGLVA